MTPTRIFQFLVSAAALAAFTACGTDAPVTGPEDLIPPPHPTLPAVAIHVRVDVARRTVTLGPRTTGSGDSKDASVSARPDWQPSLALLGDNEVLATRSNVCFSDVNPDCGEPPAGKVRVRFDVTFTNRLTGATLVTPTFPPPPLGQQGLLLFPYSISNIVPFGAVTASTDWDADPFPFFNDVICEDRAGSDCYRFEPYLSPLGPGATSETRTIGFDIDPQVGNFEFDMVLAADIENGPVLGPGGGTFEGCNGTVLVTVPPNAFAQDVSITFQSTFGPQPPSPLGVVEGTVCQIGPEEVQFVLPVQLTIEYDPVTLPAGAEEASLRLFKVVNNAWEEVTGSSVDATADAVTADVSSLGTYGILAPLPPPPPPPPRLLMDIPPFNEPTGTISLSQLVVEVAVLSPRPSFSPETCVLGSVSPLTAAPVGELKFRDLNGDGDAELILSFRRSDLNLTAGSSPLMTLACDGPEGTLFAFEEVIVVS